MSRGFTPRVFDLVADGSTSRVEMYTGDNHSVRHRGFADLEALRLVRPSLMSNAFYNQGKQVSVSDFGKYPISQGALIA